jgi:hypothetical protein
MHREVVWEFADRPGLEHLTISSNPDGIDAGGVILVEVDGETHTIRYQISCAPDWSVRTATLTSSSRGGRHEVTMARRRDAHGTNDVWTVNGIERPDLKGCDYVDLMATPFTNTLPIRGLGLKPYESRRIALVYIRAPDLEVTRVEQEYTRLDQADPPRRFRYHGIFRNFVTELALDEHGLVIDYPPVWRRRISLDAAPAAGFEKGVLDGPGAEPHPAGDHDLYGWLVGVWDAEVRDVLPDGTTLVQAGEWHVARVLEGRAVQDVWIVPPRGNRNGSPGMGNRYGTSLRYRDPRTGEWHVVWINPVSGARNELVALREGADIVQLGKGADGEENRWTFTDITQGSFTWRGEQKDKATGTWSLAAEFRAVRRGPVPASPKPVPALTPQAHLSVPDHSGKA